MSTRIDRISEEVMKALAETLRSVKDPRVQNAMVSVVHCDVTNDLRYAKCYISVLGSEQQAKDVMKGLKSAAGWLRPRGRPQGPAALRARAGVRARRVDHARCAHLGNAA